MDTDTDLLGPCGCSDYHVADCPTRTSGHDALAAAERAYYDDLPEGW